MDSVQTDKFIYFIVIGMIILLVIWMLLKSHREKHYQQPKYYVYYIASNTIPNDVNSKIISEENISSNYRSSKKVLSDIINTESIILGNHNSSHNSTIIASPYNPPNMKNFHIGGYYGLKL